MGQVVFQATLGGQTNLVGPNTASTYNINVPTVNGTLVTTGDTSTVTSTMIDGPVTVAKGGTGQSSYTDGQLLIGNSTGNTLTKATLTAGSGISITNGGGSITINNTAAATGGSIVSGSVTLTSSSNPVQQITTTDYGQYVKLPDATTMTEITNVFNITNSGYYPLKIINNSSSIIGFIYPNKNSIVGLVDNSTSAGVWNCSNIDLVAVTALYKNNTFAWSPTQRIYIDSNRSLIISAGSGNAQYGMIFDASTNTFGSQTLIRNANVTIRSLVIATDKVLCVSASTTAVEGVVLSLSGTTITVGTAATYTAPASVSTNSNPQAPNFVAFGSTYIWAWGVVASPTNYLLGFTVSGTTVTIGTAVNALSSGELNPKLYSVTSSTGLMMSGVATTSFKAVGFSVSGTTITIGTTLTIAATNYASSTLYSYVFGSQWLAVYQGSTGYNATIVSVSGTVPTGSTASNIYASAPPVVSTTLISGNKAIISGYNGTSSYFNIITNTAGTASAGTAISFTAVLSGSANARYGTISGNTANYYLTTSYLMQNISIDISGSSPVLSGSNAIYCSYDNASYGASTFSNYFNASVKIGAVFANAYASPMFTVASGNSITTVSSNFSFPGLTLISTTLDASTEVWMYLSNNNLVTQANYARVESIA